MATYRTVLHEGKAVGRIEMTGDDAADKAAAKQLLKDLGLWRDISALDAMLNQAVSFASIALYIERELIQNGRNRRAAPAPFVVNIAFALEMYLKALSLAYTGTFNNRAHNLRVLHDSLPTEARDRIRLAIPFTATSDDLAQQRDFLKIIDNLAGAFVDWRYYFENPSKARIVNLPDALYALRLIDSACSDLRKDARYTERI